MATLLEVQELNPMSIRTTQRTKVFYFRPAKGWERGENGAYRELEEDLIKRVSTKIEGWEDIQVVRSPARYFEYYLEADSTNVDAANANDNTDALRMCVGILCSVAEEMGLTIVTVGA